MTTIDKLDIGIYFQYARRTQMIEQIYQQYHLEEASSIPPQTSTMTVIPKPTELDLLLGIVPMYTPWAYFFPPQKFRSRRRSPFSFYRVAPSLGSLEKHHEDVALLESIPTHSHEEEVEKKKMLECLKQIEKINDWLSYIIGRVGQFLQG